MIWIQFYTIFTIGEAHKVSNFSIFDLTLFTEQTYFYSFKKLAGAQVAGWVGNGKRRWSGYCLSYMIAICQATNSHISERWNKKRLLFIFIIKWGLKKEISNQWAFLFHLEDIILFHSYSNCIEAFSLWKYWRICNFNLPYTSDSILSFGVYFNK